VLPASDEAEAELEPSSGEDNAADPVQVAERVANDEMDEDTVLVEIHIGRQLLTDKLAKAAAVVAVDVGVDKMAVLVKLESAASSDQLRHLQIGFLGFLL
jgi:hypothetical protein